MGALTESSQIRNARKRLITRGGRALYLGPSPALRMIKPPAGHSRTGMRGRRGSDSRAHSGPLRTRSAPSWEYGCLACLAATRLRVVAPACVRGCGAPGMLGGCCTARCALPYRVRRRAAADGFPLLNWRVGCVPSWWLALGLHSARDPHRPGTITHSVGSDMAADLQRCGTCGKRG
jgi:hypothetical protein